MRVLIRACCAAILCLCSTTSGAWSTTAQRYQPLVMVQNAEQRMDNGKLKFCEKSQVSGLACLANSLKKWWSPEEYVTHKTGIANPEIVEIEQIGDGGMFIYFNAPDATLKR